MDNRPSFDPDLILPVLLGGFSILGILIIFLIGRLNAARASVIVVETETPFKYIFLGTEPINPTESLEAAETELLTDIPVITQVQETPVLGTPIFGTPTSLTPNNTVPPINRTPTAGTPLPTSSSASGAPLGSGTYDDVDSRLLYNGPWWIGQTSVAGAYQGTLHVSQVAESSLSFRFIGRELRLFYKGDPSYGEVTINIDTLSDTLDQSSGSEWISDSLTNNTHTVLITHASGGSINIDYVIIPDAGSTGTATATPTTTPRTGTP